MKFKAEIDMDSFYDEFGNNISKFIADELKRDMLREIKKSKEYKQLLDETIKQKVAILLNKL